GYLRGAAMVLVDLLRQDRNPGIRDSTNLGTAQLAQQPVVFLGSEGETGVVASNLASFLWLLADGFGPWEAATSDEPEPDWAPQVNRGLAAVAERFAPDHRASAAAIIAQAAHEFPDFEDTIEKLCR
ncbi:hypothetical protein ABZ712_33365, partial [Streptomyces sp. NPDC006906]